MRLPESRQTLEVNEARSSCFLSSNWFSVCEHPFIDKLQVITETAVPSACVRILGLGWKLYPGNMQHMLNKDLNLIHAESFSCRPKSSK